MCANVYVSAHVCAIYMFVFPNRLVCGVCMCVIYNMCVLMMCCGLFMLSLMWCVVCIVWWVVSVCVYYVCVVDCVVMCFCYV